MIGRDVQPPTICPSCGADEMGCQVKSGLSGRRCCDECGHGVEHHDGDGVEHHDGHGVRR